MNIVELTAKDITQYKQFITQGLMENENAFRISPADELNEGFPTQDNPYSFTLGAVTEAGELMGIVSFKREVENRIRLQHKGLLFRMYVSDQYSGRGIAKALIGEVIKRAMHLPNIEQINLTVITSNERAKGLYQKFGFQTFGVERNAVKTNGGYLDEDLMVLSLTSSQPVA